MSTSPHVLVVDDDLEIRKLLGRYLTGHGFRLSLASSRREFDERMATEKFDIVVLDVLLPDGSGIEICRGIRQRLPDLPVILVTALKEDVDRIIGLEIGADDYIGKPFNPRELLARMRAVLRRTAAALHAAPPQQSAYRFGGFTFDVATRAVSRADGSLIELTGAEFDLLRAFIERPGRVLSRDQLMDLTRGREAGPFERSIDVLMSRLRRKFSAAGSDGVFKTVRNGGYQLAVRVEPKETV